MSAEKGWIGRPQPTVEWEENHYSRMADRFSSSPDGAETTGIQAGATADRSGAPT
ncbi:hypothetical protein [Mycolicibacterium llatzerense]|uniref:hypothetical protein n=1 Tax=Mycolicibacterium llatzerense TaxID=280871 RepID=UPI0013A690B6|nr:hypothetical protein [Mycolicibacterium llatzerense]